MHRPRLLLPLALMSFAAAPAFAANVPYFENFDAAPTGTTLPADFVESGPTVGTVDYSVEVDGVAGSNDLQASITGVSATTGTTGVAANRSAAIVFPTLPGTDWTISTEFVLDDYTAPATANDNTINMGLAALGSSANFTTGTNYRLLYTLDSPTATQIGRITLSESGGGTGLTGVLSSVAANAVTLGTPYQLTLSGSYSGGILTLNGTLTGGDGTTLTVSGTDTSVLTGTNFGYRTAVNAQRNGNTALNTAVTASVDVDYDNLSVVPEPGSAILASCGLGGVLLRRRRSPAPSRASGR